MLALHDSTMHPALLCGGFRTIFFFCLVCGPLEKKKKKKKKLEAVLQSSMQVWMQPLHMGIIVL